MLTGSKILINKLIQHPINDKKILEQRQNIHIDSDLDIEILKDYENDVLWIFKIADEIQSNNAIEILFPSTFIINYMNYIEYLLDFYHIYKIYFIPITSIMYPLSTFLAPYYYLNHYMKMNVTFKSYLQIFWSVIKYAFKTTGNLKSDITKFVTIFLYVALYLYNMYQIAMFLYKTKSKLHKKMQGLIHFIRHSLFITRSLPEKIVQPYFNIVETYSQLQIHNTMSDIYRLWKDDTLKTNITSLLKTIYAIDVINSISQTYSSGEWSKVSYDGENTILWDAKNPILDKKQVENPVNLSKNIIITGPNAGGKTTYVKTILSNIILAQTIGITYSIQSTVLLYDTINSFMRISDVLGSKSYFEAEAEYCLNMIKKAEYISKNNLQGLFLMDEPMHSTPPTEGLATAYAVVEYLSQLKGISLIITTHFHKLVSLEETYPERFINLSVDAIQQDNNRFHFPLLDSKEFPKEVIDNAIKMKNKICCELNK
jgi:tRNA A37 threonylcarbamoyladenosine biosynthesis protein TsaE